MTDKSESPSPEQELPEVRLAPLVDGPPPPASSPFKPAYDQRCRELVAALRQVEQLTKERDDAKFWVGRLREWRDSVSMAVKSIPEFHTGQWGGDKEGWGFHFEMIQYCRRQREKAESEVERLQGERDHGKAKRADIPAMPTPINPTLSDTPERKLLIAAYDALRSYQYGNGSNELAEEIANSIGLYFSGGRL